MTPPYRYVSADNHLNTQWLPADLWQRRLPAQLRARGPRVVETDRGSYWSWEGRTHKRAADGSSWAHVCARSFGELDVRPRALPPADPQLACAHMDLAGIHGAVFFGDTRKWLVEDPELRLAMYRAYNDFCLDLTRATGGRLLYLPILPASHPRACTEELRRVAELGARAVELSVFDLGEPLTADVWEPLWEEAAGRQVVVCSHTGAAAGVSRPTRERGARLAHHATSPFAVASPIALMVFSGVFERHPTLSWVVAECRIGWLPFLFSWMDRQQTLRGGGSASALRLAPSDYIRRNVRFTFEDDALGAELLRLDVARLGETVMWGCDYPHPQGVWPNPDPIVSQMLDGVEATLRHEILYGRAARLFGLPEPAATRMPGAV